MKKHLGFLLIALCSFNIFGMKPKADNKMEIDQQKQSMLLSTPTEIQSKIFLDFISTDQSGHLLEKEEVYQRVSTLFLICKKTKELLRVQDIKKILSNSIWSKTYGYYEDTALHHAVFRRNLNSIKALVHHRAPYAEENTEKLVPLDVAYQQLFFARSHENRRNLTEIVEFLLALDDMVFTNNIWLYNEYLKDRKRYNFHGDTLLHIGAMTGNISLIDHCLSNPPRISVNQENNYGKTALYYAAENGHRHAVEYLLQRGAIPVIPGGRYNNLPGQRAQSRGHISISNRLFEEEQKWSVSSYKGKRFYQRKYYHYNGQ